MLPEDDFGKVFARYEKEPKYDAMIIMLNSLLGKENYFEVRKTEGKDKSSAFSIFLKPFNRKTTQTTLVTPLDLWSYSMLIGIAACQTAKQL